MDPRDLENFTRPVEDYKVLVLTLRIVAVPKQEFDTGNNLKILLHHLELLHNYIQLYTKTGGWSYT